MHHRILLGLCIGASVLVGASPVQIPTVIEGTSVRGGSFRGRTASYIATMRAGGVVQFTFPGEDRITLRFEGARRTSNWSGERRRPSVTNLYGPHGAQQLLHFGQVKLRHAWRGIDVICQIQDNGLEYVFTVDPKAEPNSINLTFDRQQAIRVDATGNLVISTLSGSLSLRRPQAWQHNSIGERENVPIAYKVEGSRATFSLGSYDPTRKLLIDPVVQYSSTLGGSGFDAGNAITTDSDGNIYVAGETMSTAFPGSSVNSGGIRAAFVTKLSSSGGAIVYTTLLFGSDASTARAIATTAGGGIVVAGTTTATNFPTLGALQQSKGLEDGFVTRLSATGTVLSSTYLGAVGRDYISGVAVASDQTIYISGYTDSSGFPTSSNGARRVYLGGGFDAFVAKLSASGNTLLYSTFIGGSGSDVARAITLRGTDACITGQTDSADLITPGTAGVRPGGGDAFAGCLTNTGSILFLRYIGGLSADEGTAIAAGADGYLYIAGSTASPDFPAMGYQKLNKGNYDAFLIRLNSSGETVSSSLLGGSGFDAATGLVVSTVGVWICGHTTSTNFPLVSPDQLSFGGEVDSFAALLKADSSGLLYSTYWGGNKDDRAYAIAPGSGVDVWITGTSSSQNFTRLAGAVQQGAPDAFDSIVLRLTVDPCECATFDMIVCTMSSQTSTPTALGKTIARVAALAALTACVVPGQTTYSISGKITNSVTGSPVERVTVTMTQGNTILGNAITNAAGVYQFSGLAAGGTYTWSANSNRFRFFPFGASTTLNGNLTTADIVAEPVAGYNREPDFDSNGVPDLIWQNSVTRQVSVNYYGGNGGATYQGWNWLNSTGAPGWTVVGTGDFDGNGISDLVWQNETTRQVIVHYYQGVGGATFKGWNFLNSTGAPGWKVVAVADFDHNGIPDLVWQNETTRQVAVHNYGGANGATFQGWNFLNSTGVPGWTVVAAADFNSNGNPDLIWQNDTTRQVIVHYYAGTAGAAFQGWGYLNAAGAAGWTVVAAADFDANLTPDLVWQEDSSGRAIVHYYSGAVFQSFAWLRTEAILPWTIVN